MNDFFLFLTISIIFSIVCWTCGLFIKSFITIKIGEGLGFLTSQLIGLLLVVSLFAIYATSGVTILTGLCIPLFFIKNKIILKKFNRNNVDIRSEITQCIPFILLLILFSFQEFLWMYDVEYNAILNVPHYDFLTYAKLGGYLSRKNPENFYLISNELINSTKLGTSPYHYPEIWLISLVHFFTGKSTVKIEMLSIFPYLKAIFAGLVFYSIRASIKNISIFKQCSLMLALGLTGAQFFEFYLNSEWLKYHDGITQASLLLAFGRKYLFFGTFTTLAILYLWKNKDYYSAFILLLCTPLFSIGTLPGILFCVGTTATYLYFKKKLLMADLYKILLCITGILIFIGLFYFIFGEKLVSKSSDQSLELFSFFKNPDIIGIKRFLFAGVFSSLKIIVMYFPVLILLTYMNKRNVNLENIVFYSSLLIGGIIGSIIMMGIPDNGQFLYNIIPITNIVLIYFLLTSFSKLNLSHRFIRIETIIIFILAVNSIFFDNKHYSNSIKPYNNLSKKTIHANLNLCESFYPDKLITGMYLLSHDEINTIDYADTPYRFKHFYLQLLDNYRDAINLNSLYYWDTYDKLNAFNRFIYFQNTIYIYSNFLNLKTFNIAVEKILFNNPINFFAYDDNLVFKDAGNTALQKIDLESKKVNGDTLKY